MFTDVALRVTAQDLQYQRHQSVGTGTIFHDWFLCLYNIMNAQSLIHSGKTAWGIACWLSFMLQCGLCHVGRTVPFSVLSCMQFIGFVRSGWQLLLEINYTMYRIICIILSSNSICLKWRSEIGMGRVSCWVGCRCCCSECIVVTSFLSPFNVNPELSRVLQ